MAAGPHFRIAVLALFLLGPASAYAQEQVSPELPIQRLLTRAPGKAAASRVFNSDCPQATCDTVWVGHSSSGPGGAFLGVGVGGTWDFDTGVAGTDSSQGWTHYALAYTSGPNRPALQRPEYAYGYGNMIDLGNTNLWHARDLAGRKYVRTGVISAWHADDMVGVKKKLNDGAEPTAVPIAGARSAWCGLRESGNLHAQDPLTGNYINGDLYHSFGPGTGAVSVQPDFPGFCSLWDQMLYKDFPSAGSGTVSFRVRTDMSNFIDTTTNGTGWFNPDPTSIANFVINPADSFMVYVGSPNENAYDTNRRWFSEVLDFSKPVQELFSAGGKYPVVSPDTLITRLYAGAQPVSGNVRVVFRVKTNRVRADGIVGSATAYNSKDGAAVLDQVQVDGGPVYGFDAVNDIQPRELAGDIAQASAPWVGTGRPFDGDFHVDNIASLIYEDLCGGVGASTRRCNLSGNVVVAGSHDNAEKLTIELRQGWESPTIDLAVRTAAPGTKNAQGIDHETAVRTSIVLDYDVYTGFMGLDQSIFWQFGGRFYGPSSVQPQSGNKTWSPSQIYPGIIFNEEPICVRGASGGNADDISSIGIPAGAVDSLRVELYTISQGWRFGGSDLGNTRGTYFDNLRVGFVRAGSAAPLSQEIWNKYQDQFPWNESVSPGDNAAFDTTAALVRSGLNIVQPATAPGVVPGDSILANAPYTGDGVTSGVRMDLVFRIDPGPGNYTVKGNRTSTLVNRDPAHPFFATYLANNGPFGTPGGHGATWNRNVWNSARMDSADVNLYPILSRAIGGPASPVWAGTLHEADPNFATLGITHNVCFLIDPNGTTDGSNLDCDGSPPPAYGAVAGTTKENTKILPDGWFTPGTHVEYFIRRSLIESPGTATLLFDTTRVFPQTVGGNDDLDQERWSSFDVLPDMWKSTRYGGMGLACLLVIDDADRRGSDPAFRGALDSLGYGKKNGATQGWFGLGPNTDPNDPAGFVAENQGQYGLNYDHYDIRAAESAEAGHPGVRFANSPGAIANKRDTSGPSAAQLATLYTNVLWLSGDLQSGTIHDTFDAQESANDIALLSGFLDGATLANRRGVWLDGDGIMDDGWNNSDNGTFLLPFLEESFGSDFAANDYRNHANTQAQTVAMLPTAPWAHPGRVYSADMDCLALADVLQVVPTVDGAVEGMQYQNLGPSPWTAAIYRPTGSSRDYRTLIDGFDLSHLRGNFASIGDIGTVPGTDFARAYWLDDAVAGLFQICARKYPGCCTGDLPGIQPGRFTNANLGAAPNPSFAGRAVSLRFTLAKAQPVTLRIYNVAGREVARVAVKGLEGENAARWDGTMANGARAAAGVYFYSLDGVDVANGARSSKMILLSSR